MLTRFRGALARLVHDNNLYSNACLTRQESNVALFSFTLQTQITTHIYTWWLTKYNCSLKSVLCVLFCIQERNGISTCRLASCGIMVEIDDFEFAAAIVCCKMAHQTQTVTWLVTFKKTIVDQNCIQRHVASVCDLFRDADFTRHRLHWLSPRHSAVVFYTTDICTTAMWNFPYNSLIHFFSPWYPSVHFNSIELLFWS